MTFKKGETPKGAKPFKKGESGNAKGYPKGVPNRSTVLRKVLAMKMTVKDPLTEKDRKTTVEEAVILGLVARAISGDVAAVREVLDTMYGTNKAQMDLDVTTNGKDLPATQLYLPDNGRG